MIDWLNNAHHQSKFSMCRNRLQGRIIHDDIVQRWLFIVVYWEKINKIHVEKIVAMSILQIVVLKNTCILCLWKVHNRVPWCLKHGILLSGFYERRLFASYVDGDNHHRDVFFSCICAVQVEWFMEVLLSLHILQR